MTLIINDNFNRANANPIGGIYSSGYPWWGYPVQLLSDAATSTAASNFNAAFDTTNSYLPDQFAAITVGTLGSSASLTCVLRFSQTVVNQQSAATMYINGQYGSNITFQVAGSGSTPTSFALNTAPTTGDVYLFSVIGQTYKCYQNGALVATYTDLSNTFIGGGTGFGIGEGTSIGGTTITLFQTGDNGYTVAWWK